MMENKPITIFGININSFDYDKFLNQISIAMKNDGKKSITYVTANSLNLIFDNDKLINIFNQFDLIHPDGMGVFIASQILYGKNGLKKRITGSDFYPIFNQAAIKNKWKIFFFGDEEATLKKILTINPELVVSGWHNGFNYNNDDLVTEINNSITDILIVGLGCPKQEKWIIENKNKLSVKVIIAVGDGIKTFAGIKKRGNRFFQTLGLEWVIRLINNPFSFWKRYLIGIPLFLFRVIRSKYSNYK